MAFIKTIFDQVKGLYQVTVPDSGSAKFVIDNSTLDVGNSSLVQGGENLIKDGIIPNSGSDGAYHLYVSVLSGSDSNNGLTSATSFRTIQMAIDRANRWLRRQEDKDLVIEVASGTYVEDVKLVLAETPKRRVIVRGDISTQTVLASGTATAATDTSITDTAATFITQPSNITGVTIIDHATTHDGNGTLMFLSGNNTLKWQAPNSSTFGEERDVSAGGTFRLNGGNGTFIRVTVTSGSTPASNQSDTVPVTNLAGLILRLYSPLSQSITERWQTIRNYSNQVVNPILANSFGGGIIPSASWAYQVLRPSVQITGSATGTGDQAPLEITLPWLSAQEGSRYQNVNTLLQFQKPQVVLAWLRVTNDDALALGSSVVRGGMVRAVGCVFDGANGGIACRRAALEHGLDSGASGDAVFGLTADNTKTLFSARSVYKATTATKVTVDLIESLLSVGPVTFGTRAGIFADKHSYLDLTNGGAIYRGYVVSLSSICTVLLGSAGLGFLWKGQVDTGGAGSAGPGGCVVLMREAHASFRAASNVELQDVDQQFINTFSHNSITLDFANFVVTRMRAPILRLFDGSTAQVRSALTGTTGNSNFTPVFFLDGPDIEGITIAGVTRVEHSPTTPFGSGTLIYSGSSRTLEWKAPTDGGFGLPVTVSAGGTFILTSSAVTSGTLTVHVKEEQLLTSSNVSNTVTIFNQGLGTGIFTSLGPAGTGNTRTAVSGGTSGARVWRTV